MDNVSRSHRTREAALTAALAIIARDGPGRLTLDAIARESGISKGGLMHQFRTKEAVLKALLERQNSTFEDFCRAYLAKHGADHTQPQLAARIATSREALARPYSIAFAVVGALAQDPALLSTQREIDATSVEAIKAEAPDPDLALLRWLAARGLAITSLLGVCPLSSADRERLFARLLDDRQWDLPSPAKAPPRPRHKRKAG